MFQRFDTVLIRAAGSEAFDVSLEIEQAIDRGTFVTGLHVNVSRLELIVSSPDSICTSIPIFAHILIQEELGLDFWLCWDRYPPRLRNAQSFTITSTSICGSMNPAPFVLQD
uniref:AlNc14C156G7640 protein n=1 Tax=Albugo laibachii Nc14 TaxID=890382 RepID=F0WME3_9STRA|nr:AlNc14C156G7640 [Albugo laibachii Nc14]|eukprot:CCA22475.1 AlNc14C156G7640 [Albugo laibachii Nc14]